MMAADRSAQVESGPDGRPEATALSPVQSSRFKVQGSTFVSSSFRSAALLVVFTLLAAACVSAADTTNVLALRTDLPNVGLSAIRALGALAIVLALFFGGVWLFRNGQRAMWRKTGVPKLSILETRSLGNRMSVYVVGYDRQRLLLGSSPSGLSMLTRLPEEAEVNQIEPAAPAGRLAFSDYLQQVLKGK